MQLTEPLNYPGKYEAKGIETNCAVCGKSFIKKAPVHKYCPDCAKEVHQEQTSKWRKEHKEQMKQACRRYYAKNRENLLSRQKVNYRLNRERKLSKNKNYYRSYYEKNRDYILYRNRVYRCSKKHDNCEKCPYDDCIKE